MTESETFLVELIVKPTDDKYGCGLAQQSIPAALQPDVPFTYSRTFVPDALTRTGIGIDSWRRALDGATKLLKERNAAIEAGVENAAMSVLSTFILLGVSFGVPLFVLFYSLLRPDILVFGFMVATVFLFHYLFHFCLENICNRKCMEVIANFEEKWSDLSQEVDEQLKCHGVAVETVRTNVVKRGHAISWTVGLMISYRMKPANADEKAWCIANSEHSDVEDDEFQRRNLRVTKISQSSNKEDNLFVVGNGPAAMPAAAMPVAFATVVDEHALDEGFADGTSDNEMRTLIDIV